MYLVCRLLLEKKNGLKRGRGTGAPCPSRPAARRPRREGSSPTPLPPPPLGVFSVLLLPVGSTLFPYTTLFRSKLCGNTPMIVLGLPSRSVVFPITEGSPPNLLRQDRKSTRLNSSHRCISYAVFCLKKKMA